MADWIGINSSHLDSYCGYTTTHTLERALDGDDYWAHYETETHSGVFDLGYIFNVTKVRGRSDSGYDPIEVDIYVSIDGINWGVAVASGINTWVDTAIWQEVNTTPKAGRYVKFEVIDTEDAVNNHIAFGASGSFQIFDVYVEAVAGEELNGVVSAESSLSGNIKTTESLTGLVTTGSSAVGDLGMIIALEGSSIAQSSLIGNIQSGFLTMSPEILSALINPYSGGAWLWLIEICIPGYNVIRHARNPVDIVYAGVTYTKNNLDLNLPSLTGDGSIPRTIIRVAQDADYTLEDKINATQGAGGGRIKIIRAHEDFLDKFIVELEREVRILTADSDTKHVIFRLGIPNPLLKKVPLRRYSSKICPYSLPGLFKGIECQYVGGDTACGGKYTDCLDKGNEVHFGADLGLDPNVTRV